MDTPHLQGYLECKNAVRLATLKGMNPRAHWEPRHGTQLEAIEYCKKEGDITEFGAKALRQGQRTDIEECASMIKSGVSLKRIAEDQPAMYVKFHKGFNALKSILIEPRTEKPEVIVYYGSTGTGKTRRAYEELTDFWEWSPQMGEWFDGYEGQSQALFDEFRGQMKFGFVLKLLDRYRCRVQVKGGSCEFRATKIIFTSPKHPDMWYSNDGCDKISQLMRRIDTIICMNDVAQRSWHKG